MNKFSSYLKKKKSLVKELVELLGKEYSFVSVLGTDVQGKSYAVDKSSISIQPASVSECGFVLRVFYKGVYSEYSFNEIEKNNLNDIKNAIDNLVKSNVKTTKIYAKMIEEEKLVKNFVRKAKGEVYNDEEIINKLKDIVEYGSTISDLLINVRASIEVLEVSKMYISLNKELTQYYTWNNPRSFALVKRNDVIKYAYDGFGGNNMEEDFKTLKSSVEKTVKLAVELLDATLPTPGVYTIITDPSITGLIAHEAFGHGLEMDQFVKDRAQSVDYMNKPVASKILSMHDGAKSTFSVASYFFDDEGCLGSDTKIIDKGILIGGICDSVSASILGYHPTGNGRRESYKRKAYTRMTNTFFEKGKSNLSDMIKSVDYGYFISTTNNGMEDPKNWGIQCTALYGREIKNGEFTGKIISPVVMSGYVIDLLQSISMISKDEFDVCGSGSCGKGYKEWVRVSDGGSCLKAEVKIG